MIKNRQYTLYFFTSLLFFFISIGVVSAQESPDPQEPRQHSFLATAGARAYLENDLQGVDTNMRVDYRHEYFFLAADLSMIFDDRYESFNTATDFMYPFINEGGVGVHFGDPEEAGRLELRAGRLDFDDVIDSPYSMFVSEAEYPPMIVELTYAHSYFFYTSRGIVLNYNSINGYPDRGANLKTFGIDLGNGIRFGVQEGAVYTELPFDIEYFTSPIPQIYTQYTNKSVTNPWGQMGNDNYLIGLFGEYTGPRNELFGQLLVDDYATYADNPKKIAWQLGGRRHSPFGSFGLYHGGSTKYTFQAYGGSGGSDTEYEYTYFPVTYYTVNGEERSITPEENAIGYRNGENNLALLADYAGSAAGVDLGAALEYVVTGAQSPNNPWFDEDTWTDIPGPSTKLLDGEVLEHELTASVSGRRCFGPWTFTASAMGGFVWNQSQRVAATDGNSDYFVPQAGRNRLLYALSLGGRYTVGIE
jgi:hypothetical protein